MARIQLSSRRRRFTGAIQRESADVSRESDQRPRARTFKPESARNVRRTCGDRMKGWIGKIIKKSSCRHDFAKAFFIA
jgi:hypothetical protein